MNDYIKSIFLILYGYASCFTKVGCITINLECNFYAYIYPDEGEVTVNNMDDGTDSNYDHGHIDMSSMIIKGNKGEYKIEKY